MRIALCDDNQMEQARYKDMLISLSSKLSVPIDIVTYSNGKTMLFEMGDPDTQPDIIYLDINMPDMSGVDVASELRNTNFKGEIVFLTQSDKYWKNAFDYHAFHYIVKDDCTDKRFAEIYVSVIQTVLEKDSEYMIFSSCGEVVNIQIRDIEYFEVRRNIIIVHYTDGQFEFYSTLSKIAEELLDRGFVQVHRSYLVSLNHIVKITYETIIMKDNTNIPVGRKYYKGLKEAFAERWQGSNESYEN